MGDLSHNLLALKKIEKRKRKENIMGVMVIELGSLKIEKCNYQVYFKINYYSRDLKSGSLAQFRIDTEVICKQLFNECFL